MKLSGCRQVILHGLKDNSNCLTREWHNKGTAKNVSVSPSGSMMSRCRCRLQKEWIVVLEPCCGGLHVAAMDWKQEKMELVIKQERG